MMNTKVGTRLGLGFAAVLILQLLTGSIGLWNLWKDEQLVGQLVTEASAKERLITEWHDATMANSVRSVAVMALSDETMRQPIAATIKDVSARISAIQKALDAMQSTPEEAAMSASIAQLRGVYLDARAAMTALKKSGDDAGAARLYQSRQEPALAAYLAAIDKLARYQQQRMAALSAELNVHNRAAMLLVCAVSLAALATALAAGWTITRGLTRQLGGEPGAAMEVADRIADGDLSMHIAVAEGDRASLMFALARMREHLAGIVGQVRGATDSFATAAAEIAAGNLDLSARTEAQAGSLEETASTMEELTGTASRNADHARQANQLAVSASAVAGEGGALVAQVVTTMSSIHDSARRIADIIGVIDGIAFQTNILALNAAVEAARAGEQGRGFAVVASEVRNLAQRSAAAAKEIKALIDDSVDKVETGSRQVGQAGNTMHQIVASIERVAGIMGEISSASQEQTEGVAQVNQAIGQMDEVTQQNAALVEQAAATAGSLQEQAVQLARVVSSFKLAAAPATSLRLG